MFHSFFTRPRLFVLSGVGWALFCILLWNFAAYRLSDPTGIARLAGWDPTDVWRYQFTAMGYAIFAAVWLWAAPHRWAVWSVAGTTAIVFITWFQVQLDVMINEWFGSFYDLIQTALGEPNSITAGEYYGQLFTFLKIAMVFIFTAVIGNFLTSHYVFRWRTAMNDHYVAMWPRVRQIEGASQRIQEDTMKFASIMETLGSRLIDAVLTLIAFLPILWGLSANITALPIIGPVPQPLVFVALMWSVVGTTLLALAGYRLPGLEFRNQRVEAAFRKELVLGEDDPDRARPPTLSELYANVRRNYFRLYLNYLYFNIVRYGYLQAGVIVPYLALGPTIVATGFTLGVMQQIVRAFGRVESSFQFLVMSWTTIVELISIYKRLAAFDAAIKGEALPGIEFEGDAPTEPSPAE